MDHCAYHSRRWRGLTQQLLNLLRGKLFLPRHIRHFSQAVCTCKGGSGDDNYSLVDLEQWISGLQSPSPVVSASSLLKHYLTSAKDPSLSSDLKAGLILVVATIKEAGDGDYHRLEPKPKDKGVQLPPVTLKETFEIPLSSSHIGVFLGAGGKHIKQLCSKYEVKVHLGEENEEEGSKRRRSNTRLFGETVKVTVCHLPEEKADVEGFKDELVKRSKDINKSREKHLSHVATFTKRRYLQRLSKGTSASVGVYDNPKEAAAEQFEKKQHAKSKQTTAAKTSSGSSLLREGHCLHCLAPYNRQETDCQYHSGYLVAVKQSRPNQGYSWSCCKKRTANKHPTHDLNSKTGCCTGQHLWRPGKGTHAKGKGGVSGLADDFSV